MSASGPRSASAGLGVPGGFKPGAPPTLSQWVDSMLLVANLRFVLASGARSASVGGTPAATALLTRPAMTRTPSQHGPGHPIGSNRTCSKRGD